MPDRPGDIGNNVCSPSVLAWSWRVVTAGCAVLALRPKPGDSQVEKLIAVCAMAIASWRCSHTDPFHAGDRGCLRGARVLALLAIASIVLWDTAGTVGVSAIVHGWARRPGVGSLWFLGVGSSAQIWTFPDDFWVPGHGKPLQLKPSPAVLGI